MQIQTVTVTIRRRSGRVDHIEGKCAAKSRKLTKFGEATTKESMKQYLPNASDNFLLVDKVFKGISEKMKNETGARRAPQRVVYLVWHSSGIIENGGLFSFFEHDFDVEEVARAYESIGLPESASMLRTAIAKFPNSRRPADFQSCLQLLAQHEEFFESLGTKFWDTQQGLEDVLASYIKKHPAAFSEHVN